MKFKLDENLGPANRDIFIHRGHDCVMAREQGLGGASDARLWAAALSEDRILVTTDHGFGNVITYDASRSAGIAVLNPPGIVSRGVLGALTHVLLDAVEQNSIQGKLWIVEPSRIREHEPGKSSP
jgi:predicted nuclease of predicted toxin-antitoxin system